MKPGKLRDSLIEQADMARLSRRLVQLEEDCDLPIPLEGLRADRDLARTAGGVPDRAWLYQPTAQTGRRAFCRCEATGTRRPCTP